MKIMLVQSEPPGPAIVQTSLCYGKAHRGGGEDVGGSDIFLCGGGGGG